MLDEMTIRKLIEYDGSRYHGYVDLGTGIEVIHENNDMSVAKDALVFMLVAINDSWKFPVGYFFIDGLASNLRANLVNNCLTSLNDSGVEVVSVTFDGTSTNLLMAKKLGCNFDFSNPSLVKTFFPHPCSNSPVHIILDACHMIKLIRNTLGEKNSFVDNQNKIVSWNYITLLHKLQENEGLHAANKLRTTHINFHKRKMNVRLATQLFSESVADAIVNAANLGLQQFEGHEATVNFIRIINRVFDILNSRNLLAKGWKKPISSENANEVFQFLEFTEGYILSLKESVGGNLMVTSKRKTGFLGFVICIHSLRALYKRLIEESPGILRFLLTYKLSQDNLELFFGTKRSKGGFNDNPTVRQFSSAYKRIIVHKELKDVENGNCLALERTAILHVSGLDPESALNNSVDKKSLLDDYSEVLIEGCNFDDDSYLVTPNTIIL